jgi:hypothetical protein
MISISDVAPKMTKRPSDTNRLTKIIADITALENDAASSVDGKAKDEDVASLGRHGGLKRSKAPASVLSSDDHSRIASLAAKKRWSKLEEADEQ